MMFDGQHRHLCVRDPLAFRVVLSDTACLHAEPRIGSRVFDVAKHSLEAAERTSCPVLADLAEETMLDRIPLGAAGWIVTDRNLQS